MPDADAAEVTEWAGKWLVVQRRGRWEYVARVGAREAAVIVAVDDEGHVLLVDQYRVPLGRRVLELPAGLVDDGEDVETTAARELEEETGYRATHVRAMLGEGTGGCSAAGAGHNRRSPSLANTLPAFSTPVRDEPRHPKTTGVWLAS